MSPLTIWVTARELRVGDYIHGEGEIVSIRSLLHRGLVVAHIKDRPAHVFGVKDPVEIRLEDDGR